MKKMLALVISATLLICGCRAGDNPFQKEISLEGSAPVNVVMTNVEADYASYANTMYGWGLKKNVNAPPEIPEKIQKMMDTYDCLYLDSIPKTLYLTFDEGYENGYTGQILDVLKKQNVKAAFFVTGPYLKKETELVQRMFDEGHIVGNHTVGHPSLPQLSGTKKVEEEIVGLAEICKELYGNEMHYFRPPRGEYSERTLKICQDLGYQNVFWSFAYQDWETGKQRGTDYAYDQIMKGVHDGCVLLLHAVSKDNAEVLDRVITDLKNQGYVFRSLDEFGKNNVSKNDLG